MSDKRFRLMATAQATGDRKGEVKIYSVITPYKYDEDDATSNEFDKQLKALGDVDEITIRINSPGGVVSEAIAMRTMLMKHPATKTIDIEGCCDSAATLIACIPGANVRMAMGAEYMIHCCSALGYGHADDILSLYNSMQQTDTDMSKIYAERTGKTPEECMELMQAETWYGAEEAMEAGFVDEVIRDLPDSRIAACAVDAETFALMKTCYTHVPERELKTDTNSAPAAAAASQGGNTKEGVTIMDGLNELTAEQLRQERPELVESIAGEAIKAERERVQAIRSLTRRGDKWQALAKKAIDEGTSAEDYLRMVIAEEVKAGEDYLDARKGETEAAANVGAGDPKDHDDDAQAKAEKAAKEIAELAKDMSGNGFDMA